MARKKKNKHSQTFDVYPYLDEYQYLMKTGGALPWYQTKGPVETKRKYTVEGVEYDTYEEFVEAWNKKMPNANPPPKEYLDKQYDNNTGTHNSTDQPVDNECECPEGSENAGTTYFSSGGCGYNKSMCGEMIDGTSPVETPVSPNADYLQKEKENLGLLPWEEGYTEENDAHDPNRVAPPTEEEEVVEEVGDPLVGDATTPIAKTTDDQKLELGDLEQQYKDGTLSKRELEESRKRYNVDGKRSSGYTSGDTEFETLPGSSWNLLANAVKSGSKFANNLGKGLTNPKTGKPYERSDFTKTTADWSKVDNENKATVHYSPEALKAFMNKEEGYEDLKLSDLAGSKTTFGARDFNEFQENRSQMDRDAGIDPLFSEQTMSKYDGTTSYNDVNNETYDPDVNAAMPNNPMFQKNRAHTNDDLTEGDIAEGNLADMSTTDIIFDDNGNPIKYKGFGSDGSGEGSTGTWDYDKNKKYGDWEETVIDNNQAGKNNRRAGLNTDGSDPNAVIPNEGELTEVSRVTNEDFSVTITYDDGSEKIMEESSQAKKNRARKAKGKMGLEMFVYGGQPSKEKLSFADMYSKGGDTLRKFLEGDEIDEATENLELDEERELTDEELLAAEEQANLNFTEEEINSMDETSIEESGVVETTTGEGMQGLKNDLSIATKTGLGGKINESLGNFGQFAADAADFGNSLYSTWNRDASETKAEMEGNTAADMFTVQESSQGIHDVQSGDAWTNMKVDEIYSGNTMKGGLTRYGKELKMQAGGPPPQQQAPVEELNFQALGQFGENNMWDSEISYSPEVLEYQKRIMGKMRDGGSLPIAEEGWWDGMKKGASNLYDSAKETYDNTDVSGAINKGLDYTQTALTAGGLVPAYGIIPDIVNTAVSTGRAGYSALTGDTEGTTKHLENATLNAASAVPGPTGWAAGGAGLVKDTMMYAGAMDDKSMSTTVADAISSPKATQIAENTQAPKINKVARDGGEQELEVDYELLQELIKAGADIEII